MASTEHHHRHHHHHHHRDSGDSLMKEIRSFNDITNKGKKHNDTTSKFRNNMRQRRLRKKIFERLLFALLCIVAGIIMTGVIFAYFIDK